MKRKLKRITLILLLTLTIALSNNLLVSNASTMLEDADDWLEKGAQNPPITPEDVWPELLPIAQMLIGFGAVVVLGCFMWLGIKYMTTDPSGKAHIKQKLIGLVIATVIIFGGIGIFTIIVNEFNGIFA